ncbi:DEAD/DEAH box helicase [Nakamurella endophytica]|uniref:DEAD/DEAH box helicase n=1 Tax=Nakamurella endophytica TaxID=1748367 RepID=UPI001668131E
MPDARASAPPDTPLDRLLRRLPTGDGSPVTHVERLPAREGRTADWPAWVPVELRTALRERHVLQPWTHQVETADLAHAGVHVVVSTGTASGKSLSYQLPVLSELLTDDRATALYLAPTKALGVDQLGSVESLGLPGIRAARYDGDTPQGERDWAREHARLLVTNPDMLHRRLLPGHDRWLRLLRNLRFVVVDECHAYRGVFGSHVALVLRRLRRVAARYGSAPVFVLASATVADPAGAAGRLVGAPVRAVTEDGSPSAGADFVLWEPPVVPDLAGEVGAPVRRSAPAEAAHLLADLVADGARTLAFVRSRHGVEQTALTAARRLTQSRPDLAGSVAAYRGGYLPEERRQLERSLVRGELLGLATTNALELGVDIAGLDAAVLAGYPGTLASVWQQAGRAGRGRSRALVVFVAREDPLDTYLVHHPGALFGRPVEATVIDPTNPVVLAGQLSCAAAEHHLDEADVDLFGGSEVVLPVLEDLVRSKVLRQRPTGWYRVDPRPPAERVDLRGSGGGQVSVVDADTARLLGTVDHGRAPSAVHPGAVHLHRGEPYTVLDLDLEDGVALVRADRPDWTTLARSVSTVSLTGVHRANSLGGGVTVGLGPVRVTEQVVGYLRRRPTGEVIDVLGLDMPEHELSSRAVWYAIEPQSLTRAGLSEARIPGALHAAEHAAIGLLPLFAGCDRWDIGGLSTRVHPDTGQPTVIVYDGVQGGAGFAARGFDVLYQWLSAVRAAVAGCGCAAGCPSCVQSPKCGNGNHPLDKSGAVTVLQLVLSALETSAVEAPPDPTDDVLAAGGLGTAATDLHPEAGDGEDGTSAAGGSAA